MILLSAVWCVWRGYPNRGEKKLGSLFTNSYQSWAATKSRNSRAHSLNLKGGHSAGGPWPRPLQIRHLLTWAFLPGALDTELRVTPCIIDSTPTALGPSG